MSWTAVYQLDEHLSMSAAPAFINSVRYYLWLAAFTAAYNMMKLF